MSASVLARQGCRCSCAKRPLRSDEAARGAELLKADSTSKVHTDPDPAAAFVVLLVRCRPRLRSSRTLQCRGGSLGGSTLRKDSCVLHSSAEPPNLPPYSGGQHTQCRIRMSEMERSFEPSAHVPSGSNSRALRAALLPSGSRPRAGTR